MITTETALWKKIKPWLEAHGPTVRIESATSNGVSDAMWSTKFGVVFIELKVRKGNYINLQNWQVAFHERWLQHSSHDWFVIAHRSEIDLYPWSQLASLTRMPTGKGVKLNLKDIMPSSPLEDKIDVDMFLQILYGDKRSDNQV